MRWLVGDRGPIAKYWKASLSPHQATFAILRTKRFRQQPHTRPTPMHSQPSRSKVNICVHSLAKRGLPGGVSAVSRPPRKIGTIRQRIRTFRMYLTDRGRWREGVALERAAEDCLETRVKTMSPIRIQQLGKTGLSQLRPILFLKLRL